MALQRNKATSTTAEVMLCRPSEKSFRTKLAHSALTVAQTINKLSYLKSEKQFMWPTFSHFFCHFPFCSSHSCLDRTWHRVKTNSFISLQICHVLSFINLLHSVTGCLSPAMLLMYRWPQGHCHSCGQSIILISRIWLYLNKLLLLLWTECSSWRLPTNRKK